jgi:hypothetical protein
MMARPTKQHEHLTREREEIAARLAKFRATQERFTRERAEYAEHTLQKAWLDMRLKEQRR